MRLFFIGIFVFCFSVLPAQDRDIQLIIEQINIITGASVKYNYCDNRVKTYKRTQTDIYKRATSKRISEEKSDSIDMLAIRILHEYNSIDTLFANPSILDGYKWVVKISSVGLDRKFVVYNCYHNQLDELIRIINGELRKRKRLIFPTGLLYSKKD